MYLPPLDWFVLDNSNQLLLILYGVTCLESWFTKHMFSCIGSVQMSLLWAMDSTSPSSTGTCHTLVSWSLRFTSETSFSLWRNAAVCKRFQSNAWRSFATVDWSDIFKELDAVKISFKFKCFLVLYDFIDSSYFY